MVDDLGYSDIGCYGGEINTPNLDALAQGGMRFRQFYNAGKCHSSRVTLLSVMVDDLGYIPMRRGMPKRTAQSSYITAMWHEVYLLLRYCAVLAITLLSLGSGMSPPSQERWASIDFLAF